MVEMEARMSKLGQKARHKRNHLVGPEQAEDALPEEEVPKKEIHGQEACR